MRLIPFYIFLLLNSFLQAQNFSKKEAIMDFEYLNEAVVNGHPINYNPERKTTINAVIDELKSIQSDSISNFEYSLFLGKALQEIGDIHTSVMSNPLSPKTETYCPVRLLILNESLYLLTDSSNVNNGEKVLAINDVTAQKIIDVFSNFRAADGGSTNFSKQYFNLFSETYIARYLSYPETYNIQTEKNSLQLKASDQVKTRPVPIKESKIIFSSNNNYFTIKDQIALLKMSSFTKNDKHFLTTTFNYIEENNIKNLVIDLRGNLGGNRKTAVDLCKQLIDTTFSYSIVQPKLHPFKYLTQKGKVFYVLSKLKYNLGDIFKSHKSELGRKFIYRYQPNKKNFDGKIVVLTDGFTASASTMLTSWLKQYSTATFVGSQSGGGYNGNGGGSFPIIQLPYSKIEIKFPVYRLVLDGNSMIYEGIIPDLQPLKTIEDITNNRDVELETVMKIFSLIK